MLRIREAVPKSDLAVAYRGLGPMGTGCIRTLDNFLSLTLADPRGVGERVLHTMPDMARNFDAVSAGP
jgi:hypothetical protein